MSEITESEERLARPLIRLAKLVGVGTSYLGMSHDYHEIDDDVLIEVLAALGIDASSESAQLIAIRRILNERYARLVAPTVLHIAGSEDRVLVNTGILDVPSASITLENGEPYQGTIEVGPGDGSQAYDLDGTFISNAAVVIPADLPIGYHTLHVKVADRVQDATLISAPDRVDLLDPMKGGSLWGWMAQLYSIRSSNSWGVAYSLSPTRLPSIKSFFCNAPSRITSFSTRSSVSELTFLPRAAARKKPETVLPHSAALFLISWSSSAVRRRNWLYARLRK